MDFLSEEQQRAFWQADFIYSAFRMDMDIFSIASGIECKYDAIIGYIRSGYDYESVVNAFKSVLPEDTVNQLIKSTSINYNGEFVYKDGARGSDLCFMNVLKFEKVEADDNSVSFKARAGYGAEPGAAEITVWQEYNFRMEKIGENWIVTQFEMWK